MTWHLVCRLGNEDTFFPEIGDEPRLLLPFERPGDPWHVGYDVFRKLSQFADISLSDKVRDLLLLAMSVYSADLRIPRKTGSDRWKRDLHLYLPVSDLEKWKGARETVERTLEFLTGDEWTIDFRESGGWPKLKKPKTKRGKKKKMGSIDQFCLFSGGLDSLVGAIDLLSSGNRVALIGHHGAGITNKVQEGLLESLIKKFEDQAVPFMFHVQPKKLKAKDGEPTMRSRSFLFFSLGVAVAEGAKGGEVLTIAENGLISLNVPLAPSRSGSCSTRTTHPHYIALYRKLLKKVGLSTKLSLPYRFMTKGEMVGNCKDKGLIKATAPRSMSCSHSESGRFQGFRPGQHCGYCVPCIIRRAAMLRAGIADSTPNIDVLSQDLDHREDRGRDLRAFRMALEREHGITKVRSLFRVLATGPLAPEEAAKFAEMYQRGVSEVRAFLNQGENK